LYHRFHSKGLNIIGVSLDEEVDRWKEAIAKDKLTWTHVSNLEGWKDPIAILYEVEQIPCTFLLDSSGKVIAKDLMGEQLEERIESLVEAK
jgi:alkyl hydroperoxide reductase subunit AhpC